MPSAREVCGRASAQQFRVETSYTPLAIRLFKMLKSVLAEHLDEQLVTYIRDQSCIIHQIDTLRHFDKYESADEMLAIWGNMTTVLKVRTPDTTTDT